MSRFLLFAGSNFYPTGGWGDYIDSYPTLEIALEGAANTKEDWWQIVDIEAGRIVKGN